MANIRVLAVSGKNYFKVDFGVYAEGLGFDYDFFWPQDIKRINKNHETGIIELLMSDGSIWLLSYQQESAAIKAFIVDEVNGTTSITDNDHLATLIADLKG